MRVNRRWMVVGAVATTMVAAGLVASGAGDTVQLGTSSLKVPFNWVGDCSLTNYNESGIRVDSIKIYKSDGAVRAQATNVLVGPNKTARVSFSGLNDRYHCVATGFHLQSEAETPACESRDIAEKTRLLLDVLYNGSSTAEAEGELIGGANEPCCSTLSLDLTTDTFGYETSWTLTNLASATQIASAALGSLDSYSSTHSEFCVSPTDCYEFTINDSFGDGICCTSASGHYELSFDGQTVESNVGNDPFTGSTKTSLIGNCPP